MTHDQLQQIRDALSAMTDASLHHPTRWKGVDAIEILNAALAAPQREWQGLTKDEINNCAGAEIYPSTWAMAFARAIESKLKEKNHE